VVLHDTDNDYYDYDDNYNGNYYDDNYNGNSDGNSD
jgi:hypothetical protein